MEIHDNRLPALIEEVLIKGGEACLPCNLSDAWVDRLSRQLDRLFTVVPGESDCEPNVTEPLALVLAILLAKEGAEGEYAPPSEELIRVCLAELHFELALEGVARLVGREAVSATLDSIFTGRGAKSSLAVFPAGAAALASQVRTVEGAAVPRKN